MWLIDFPLWRIGGSLAFPPKCPAISPKCPTRIGPVSSVSGIAVGHEPQ